MTNITPADPMPHQWLPRLLHYLPRGIVGLILVATGTGKGLDMPGFVEVLTAYALLPLEGNVLVAYTLPGLELVTGVCLLARLWLRQAAWVAVGLHVLLLSVASFTLWRGVTIANCGCFGVFLARPLTRLTILEDIAMLGLSLWVLREAHRSVRHEPPERPPAAV